MKDCRNSFSLSFPTLCPGVQKAESEEMETPKPHVKLRRVSSEAPRPSSTPPVIAASGVRDEDDEEKIIAELEVGLGWSHYFP